jgi:acyl carrier protein
MQQRDKVVDVILTAVDEINPTLEEPVDLARGADAALYSDEGALDSLALVTLLSTVEQMLDVELGVLVCLTDEKALSQARSPFRTVGSLADFTTTLIEATAPAS